MKISLAILLFLGVVTLNFSESEFPSITKTDRENNMDEVKELNNLIDQKELNMDQKIIPFLTFQKEDAERAMNFYIGLFENSKIEELNRWGKGGPGKAQALC